MIMIRIPSCNPRSCGGPARPMARSACIHCPPVNVAELQKNTEDGAMKNESPRRAAALSTLLLSLTMTSAGIAVANSPTIRLIPKELQLLPMQ